MRDTPNFDDANFALRLYELRREPELRKARQMIGDLLEGASWEQVQEVRDYAHPENAHFRQATSYWEMCSSFVNRGIFHPDVFLDTCGEAIYTYAVLEPHVEAIRRSGGPRFLVQTEKAIRDNPAIAERLADVRRRLEAARAAEAAKPSSKTAAKPAKPVRPAGKAPRAKAAASGRSRGGR
jgi:hypothetical protein